MWKSSTNYRQALWQVTATKCLAIYCAMVIAVFSIEGCGPAPNDPLRIATLPWPGYESIHLAQSLKLIDPRHIKTIELVNASQISAALTNGTVAAGLITLDAALMLLQEGVDLQIVLVMDYSNGGDALLARPEYADLNALRGKRIAVESGGVGGVLLDAALDEASFTVKDIQLVPLMVNEQVAAYTQEKVDAVVTYEPIRSQLFAQGARVLFDSRKIPGRILDVMVINKNLKERYRSQLQQAVQAHFQALDYLQAHPTDAHARIAPFLGVTPEEVADQLARIHIPDLAENHRLLTGETSALETTALQLVSLMVDHNLLKAPLRFNGVIDPLFLPPLPAPSAVQVMQ